ncbi:MAG: ATP synthase F1 subunit epsilon [Myxococcales bacterium]|nr:ATP synthase F1 subunit epsilon [Myxococcales bacterium]
MAELRLEIVTPTGRVLDVMAGEVRAPGAAGELGILPQHRPGLIKLSGGAVAWTGAAAGEVLIRGGIAEIRPDGVLILADQAVRRADADRAEAQAILDAQAVAMAAETYLDDDHIFGFASSRAYAETILKG